MNDQNETEEKVSIDKVVKQKAKALQVKTMYVMENMLNKGENFEEMSTLCKLLETLKYVGE